MSYIPLSERHRPYSRERFLCDGARSGIHDGYQSLYASINYVASTANPRLSKRLLYHYTGSVSFDSIVNTKCLWASDLNAMNDYTELAYAEDLLIRGIERANPEAAAVLVPALRSEIEAIRPQNLFSVSFSMHPELKSQWLDYAKKDGVCIGFPVEIFETALAKNASLSLDEVVYDRKAQSFLFEPIISRIIAYGTDVADKRKFSSFLSSAIAPQFGEIAPFIKHPTMFEEREVRLVSHNPQQVCTRMRAGEPVRYIEVPYRRYFYDTPQVDFLFETVYSAPRRHGYMERLREINKILTGKRVRFNSILASQVPYEFV